jgi:type I restriction enzyme S subunit
MLAEMCPNGVEKHTIEKVILRTNNIKWKNEVGKYQYIDLSSVDICSHLIIETSQIDSNNAPSRAQKIVQTDDVIFGTTRPLLKRYCLIPQKYNNQICSTGFCVLRANKKLIIPKYLFYQISKDDFYSYIDTVQQGSAYPAVSDSLLKAYEIDVPPLEIQNEIVRILDNFSEYVTSISQGLPAEIAARRKQYEYYRNELLMF